MSKLTFTIFSLLMAITSSPIQADEYSVIATDNIVWGLLNPLRGDASPRAVDLWGDRTKPVATGMLVKFKKGFSSPPHIHNVSYRGIVIEGLLHNDDPSAEKMWLPPVSYWMQPAGESHITAANAEENLIYLEIDNGPYLVLPAKEAFDNGERPINVNPGNLVWLNAKSIEWLDKSAAQIAYLWGEPEGAHGSFIKLSAGFRGSLLSDNPIKVVVVKGTATYQWGNEKAKTALSPGSFFSSKVDGQHRIDVGTELVLYINSNSRYSVEQLIKQ